MRPRCRSFQVNRRRSIPSRFILLCRVLGLRSSAPPKRVPVRFMIKIDLLMREELMRSTSAVGPSFINQAGTLLPGCRMPRRRCLGSGLRACTEAGLEGAGADRRFPSMPGKIRLRKSLPSLTRQTRTPVSWASIRAWPLGENAIAVVSYPWSSNLRASISTRLFPGE